MVDRKWFANKGQIIQIVIATIACVFSGIKAWPDMRGNELFSLGAVLFYILVGLVIFSVGRPFVHGRAGAQPALWNGGLLAQLVVTGQSLKLQLENLREAWPNDPHLLYPLSVHAMPDVIQEPKHKDLWAFRRDYRMHLAQVHLYNNTFASELARKRFPVDDMKSLDVLRMIEAHVNLLVSNLNELKTQAGITP